jgi:hypothetical protein
VALLPDVEGIAVHLGSRLVTRRDGCFLLVVGAEIVGRREGAFAEETCRGLKFLRVACA